MKPTLLKLLRSRRVRFILAAVALFFVASWLLQPITWGRDLRFNTRAELLAYEKAHEFDLWTGTYYCGDDDGRSWFLNRQKIFGNTRLSIPAVEWSPAHRVHYTWWNPRHWQPWYGKVEKALSATPSP